MNRQSCSTSCCDYTPPPPPTCHGYQLRFYGYQSPVLPMPITPHLSPDVCQYATFFPPVFFHDGLPFLCKSYPRSLSVPIMSHISPINSDVSKQTHGRLFVIVCLFQQESVITLLKLHERKGFRRKLCEKMMIVTQYVSKTRPVLFNGVTES